MEVCATCGASVHQQQKYCRNCGSARAVSAFAGAQCSYCGHTASGRVTHCTRCGTSLKTESERLATEPRAAESNPADRHGAEPHVSEPRVSERRGFGIPASEPRGGWPVALIGVAAAVVVTLMAAGLYVVWAGRTRAVVPDADAVGELVRAQLPTFATLAGLELQNVEVDPADPSNYHASFHASATPSSDLYREAGREGEIVFLDLAMAAGSPWPVSGTALLQGDARRGWTGQVTFDEPFAADVMPREAYQAQQTIVQGSPEDKAYQEAKAEQERQRQAALQEAAEREARRRVELKQREEERIARERAATDLRLQQLRAAEEAAAERTRIAAAQEQARREADARERQQREDALRREAERARQQDVRVAPGRIPKNKNVLIRLSNALKTDVVSVEDRFEAVTAEDIVVDGRVLVPAGAVLRGVVANVQSATRRNRTAKLDVAFDQLTIGSRSWPMRAKASINGRGLKGDAAKVGVGAGIGAIIGGILGGGRGAAIGGAVGGGGTLAATEGQEIDLPIGSQFQVKFDAPLDLK